MLAIALLTAAVVVGAASTPVTLPWIKTSDIIKGRMVDEAGRVRIFHGVNAGGAAASNPVPVICCPAGRLACARLPRSGTRR
jgi:hypothetical protein